MTTLVLSPRYTPDSAALWRAALEQDWNVERLDSYRVPEHLRGQDIVIYGEALFARIVAESLALTLLEPPHDWLLSLPYPYLQRTIRYTTLGQLHNTMTQALFVKPGDSSKGFDAKVYANAAELPSIETWDSDMPVIVSEPVNWLVEYRCFVLDGEVSTLSVYKRAGEAIDEEWSAPAQEMDEARDFCNHVAKSINLPPSVVIDVGKIAERGWAVIEANPAWASGIYGCDVDKVLMTLQRDCVR